MLEPRIYAVVLAAGQATRFGSSKQIARIGDTTLVNRAVLTADSACPGQSLVVLGHAALRISTVLAQSPGFRLINPRYEHGMGTSIALAAKTLSPIAHALVFTLCDQPLISSQHLCDLITTWRDTSADIVATQTESALSAPAVFGPATFDALKALDGDQGARVLFNDPRFDVASVTFADAATDIDTPEDLSRLSRSARS